VFVGIAIEQHRKLLATEVPNIVVGTPGRVLALINEKKLKLDELKRFVLDECDQMLEKLDMRRDVQAIFKSTPHAKQVMMFSATLSKEIRPVCRKFTQHVRTMQRTMFPLSSPQPPLGSRLLIFVGLEFQAWRDSPFFFRAHLCSCIRVLSGVCADMCSLLCVLVALCSPPRFSWMTSRS
jgi:hypothetical protein